MTDVLAVVLGDRLAGHLHRRRGGDLRFDYDDDYRAADEATPLSLSMPRVRTTYEHDVVSPWLWGLLPDNEAVLALWSRTFHASAASAFSLLATPVGEDCAGAVRFVGPEALEDALNRSGTVEWLIESDVAARLADLRRDATAWLGRPASVRGAYRGAPRARGGRYTEVRASLSPTRVFTVSGRSRRS
jgi:serine/threonine-protein kinase HipA